MAALITTHYLYSTGKPVRLEAVTFVADGQQYATVTMLTKGGRLVRQTVQARNLRSFGSQGQKFCSYCGNPLGMHCPQHGTTPEGVA